MDITFNTDAETSLLPSATGVSASFERTTQTAETHPLNDPEVWRRQPLYQPPTDINLAREQQAIDSIVGATRGGESIIKAIWNGDRRYWFSFYTEWDGAGKPLRPLDPLIRPLVRYGTVRDERNKIVRDVFPPRWLLVTRLEPEQFADHWKAESYFYAPEINGFKQIRPDEPPKELWLWYGTIARHTDFCCGTAAKSKKRCYGEYAPPSYALNGLRQQVKACESAGLRSHNPFEQIGADDIRRIQNENGGYDREIAQIKIDREIYGTNPYALLGVAPSMAAGLSAKDADRLVKEHFERRLQKLGKL